MSNRTVNIEIPGVARSKEHTMNRLLQSARETIAFQGVDQTTIKAIVSRANVNSVLVYRYFGGWNGIIETLFKQILSRIKLISGLTAELE